LKLNFQKKKIPEKLAEKLQKILPEKTKLQKEEGEDLEEVTLSNAIDLNSKENENNRKEAYMSDDEDETRGGGENVGCKTS